MASDFSVSALFAQHGALVYRRCRALLGQEDAARDAVQEVFLRVLAQRGSFRAASSAATWIYSIATLYCLQRLRNQRRHQLKLEHLARTAGDGSPTGVGQEDRLTLAALLEACEPEVQQIVVLRVIDGMNGDEVAEVLGLSRKTVGRKLQRFLGQARARLSQEAPPAPEVSP
jgi:RNA polymerase sigma-70 factor (ECF subfamily)